MTKIQRRSIWFGIFLVLAFLGGMLGFLVYSRWFLGVTLNNQVALAQLPPKIEANVAATNTFDIALIGDMFAKVPFKREVPIPLRGKYLTDIQMKTDIPIKFVVAYKDNIKVHTSVDINTDSGIIFPYLPHFPIKMHVPVDLDLPVAINIPVSSSIHFNYSGEMWITLNQDIKAPIDTILDTKLPINRNVSVPLLASFNMEVYPDQLTVPMVVKSANLAIPLKGLEFARR
jgi:hypothetical protein